MKARTLLVLSVAATSIAAVSVGAWAARATYVSGPTGKQVNGIYVEHPLMTIRWECVQNGYTNSGSYDMDIGSGWNPEPEGAGYVKVMSNDKSDLWLNVDGKLVPGNTFCSDRQQPDYTIWEGHLTVDTSPPKVAITSPADKTNVDAPAIVVSGDATDKVAGIDSVSVNGRSATIRDEKFSVTIDLEVGLNSLTAVAKDKAGRVASSSEITVFRRESPPRAAPPSPRTKPSVGKASDVDETAAPKDISKSAEPSPSVLPALASASPSPDSTGITLVKGVAKTGGIGLGAVTTFFLILLVLDRLGLIEIKVFSVIRTRLRGSTASK